MKNEYYSLRITLKRESTLGLLTSVSRTLLFPKNLVFPNNCKQIVKITALLKLFCKVYLQYVESNK